MSMPAYPSVHCTFLKDSGLIFVASVLLDTHTLNIAKAIIEKMKGNPVCGHRRISLRLPGLQSCAGHHRSLLCPRPAKTRPTITASWWGRNCDDHRYHPPLTHEGPTADPTISACHWSTCCQVIPSVHKAALPISGWNSLTEPEHFFFFNATEENRVENIRDCDLEEREVQFQKLLCVQLCHISRLTGLLWKSHSIQWLLCGSDPCRPLHGVGSFQRDGCEGQLLAHSCVANVPMLGPRAYLPISARL